MQNNYLAQLHSDLKYELSKYIYATDTCFDFILNTTIRLSEQNADQLLHKIFKENRNSLSKIIGHYKKFKCLKGAINKFEREISLVLKTFEKANPKSLNDCENFFLKEIGPQCRRSISMLESKDQDYARRLLEHIAQSTTPSFYVRLAKGNLNDSNIIIGMISACIMGFSLFMLICSIYYIAGSFKPNNIAHMKNNNCTLDDLKGIYGPFLYRLSFRQVFALFCTLSILSLYQLKYCIDSSLRPQGDALQAFKIFKFYRNAIGHTNDSILYWESVEINRTFL